MFLHGITLSIVYLSFVNPFVTGFFSHPQTLPSHIWDTRSERVKTNAQNNNYINNIQQSAINITVTEHELINDIVNDSHDQSWGTTTERTLIRVTRLETRTEKSKIYKRERRQVLEALQTADFVISIAKTMQNTGSGEEILGMAKKVAIAAIVIVSLCAACCCITTIVVCIKCCSNGNKRRRNNGPTTIQVPQPIFVQTSPSTTYQPQYYQQQAHLPCNSAMVQSPESRPMLPQPSAPPQPDDHSHVEYPPPPYEKLYTRR